MNLKKSLEKLREELKYNDRELIITLSHRNKIIKNIAKEKKRLNLPVKYKNIEKENMKERIRLGIAYGLNKKTIKKLFLLLTKDSRKIQEEIIKR